MGRRHMFVALKPIPHQSIDPSSRHPTPEDTNELATLMLDAYEGTVDADGSETLDDARTEVSGYFAAHHAGHLDRSTTNCGAVA